jgi:hypothetical protein
MHKLKELKTMDNQAEQKRTIMNALQNLGIKIDKVSEVEHMSDELNRKLLRIHDQPRDEKIKEPSADAKHPDIIDLIEQAAQRLDKFAQGAQDNLKQSLAMIE